MYFDALIGVFYEPVSVFDVLVCVLFELVVAFHEQVSLFMNKLV